MKISLSQDRSLCVGEYLVPLLDPSQKRQYALLVVLWVVVLIAFWNWWLTPEHNTTMWGLLLAALLGMGYPVAHLFRLGVFL